MGGGGGGQIGQFFQNGGGGGGGENKSKLGGNLSMFLQNGRGGGGIIMDATVMKVIACRLIILAHIFNSKYNINTTNKI